MSFSEAVFVVIKNRYNLFLNFFNDALSYLIGLIKNFFDILIVIIFMMYVFFTLHDGGLIIFDIFSYVFNLKNEICKNDKKNEYNPMCNKYIHYYTSFLIHNCAIIYYIFTKCFLNDDKTINITQNFVNNKFLIFLWCYLALYIQSYLLNIKNNKYVEEITLFAIYLIYVEVIIYLVILCMALMEIINYVVNVVYIFIDDVNKINEKTLLNAVFTVFKNRYNVFLDHINILLPDCIVLIKNILMNIFQMILGLYIIFIFFDLIMIIEDFINYFFNLSDEHCKDNNTNTYIFMCNKYIHYYISFLIHNCTSIIFIIITCLWNNKKITTFVLCCSLLYIHVYFLNIKNNKDVENIISFTKYLICVQVITHLAILCMTIIEIIKDIKNAVYKFIYDIKLTEDKINEKDNL
jgi:hypothetical protein